MWKNIKPDFADQIRVNRGLYHHHGIYLSDDCVIHFAALDAGSELDPSKARVVQTTLSEFLKGGILEVREYSDNEKLTLRKKTEIANYAFSCLGNAGYDVIKNNCEHFSNECAFGKRESNQVENVLNSLLNFFK